MPEVLTSWIGAPRPAEAWLWIGAWLLAFEVFKRAFWRFALISMAGTVLHEAAHFLVGLCVGAGPRSFEIWPKRSAKGWTLGSVDFVRLNWINAAPAALAPLLLLPVGLFSLDAWIVPAVERGLHGRAAFFGWIAASCLCSFWPSPQDWSLCRGSLAAWILGAAVLITLSLAI